MSYSEDNHGREMAEQAMEDEDVRVNGRTDDEKMFEHFGYDEIERQGLSNNAITRMRWNWRNIAPDYVED